ncbi:MAG: hypothetical protein U0136_18335 [Bdellovibrionota bacterium]
MKEKQISPSQVVAGWLVVSTADERIPAGVEISHMWKGAAFPRDVVLYLFYSSAPDDAALQEVYTKLCVDPKSVVLCQLEESDIAFIHGGAEPNSVFLLDIGPGDLSTFSSQAN